MVKDEYFNHGTAIDLGSQILGASHMRMRGVTGLSRAALVDGTHAEFVLEAFDEVRNAGRVVIALDLEARFPTGTVSVLLFDDVAGDGGASIAFWTLPRELDEIRVVICDVRSAGFTRLFVRILCFDT